MLKPTLKYWKAYWKDKILLQKTQVGSIKPIREMFREAHGDDLNNGIKLLEASNKAYKVNITPNNSRYYQQN